MLLHYQSQDVINQEIAAGVHYFALQLADEIVGYTAYDLIGEDTLYISKLYLKANYRGQGLMSNVFNWYETLAKESHRKLQLRVNRYNQNAIEVYLHRGFEIVDEVDSEIGDGFFMNDYFLEKNQ